MTIKIETLSPAAEKGKLNTEWILLVNEGEGPFNTEGCSITTQRGKGRPSVASPLKAGLILQPGERVRLVTGSSGRGSHGAAPEEEGVRNFYLFLKAPYLDKPGLVVRLMNRQHEVCKATYEAKPAAGAVDAG